MNFIKQFMYKAYGFKKGRMNNRILNVVMKLEGGEYYSDTLRKIFKDYHNIDVGLYTHGGCFRRYNFDAHTTIGRYCSIARTARAFNRDHPVEYKSTHAFFFNPRLGVCKNQTVEYNPLVIGNDVWIGHNAIIMPSVNKIEDGAVIAAGSVVNKDVPPYAIVVGNPGRAVRYRFSEEKINSLVESRWWDKPIEELRHCVEEFQNFNR